MSRHIILVGSGLAVALDTLRAALPPGSSVAHVGTDGALLAETGPRMTSSDMLREVIEATRITTVLPVLTVQETYRPYGKRHRRSRHAPPHR